MIQLPPIDYRERQERAMQCLGGKAMLVIAQAQGYRNSTVESPWRQDSLFYYLTGFSETDAAILLLSHRPTSEPRVILFLRDKDPVAELWNGRRLGVTQALKTLAVDESFAWSELWTKLPSLLVGSSGLSFSLGLWSDTDRRVITALREHRLVAGRRGAELLSISDSSVISGALRHKKRPEEIVRMRAAAEVTRSAFDTVLGELKPGLNERDIHAMLLHNFLKAGAEMEAYGSIVAGGRNACILHYRDNNAVLRDGELLLIDAGSQVDNYASDVTRTFPINGKFKPAQRRLYSACLQAQKDAISKAVPGSTLKEIQQECFSTLAKHLIDLGLIKASFDEAMEKSLYKHFCPHSISHWIGLDVHDAGPYEDQDGQIKLSEGMYFSVEPGIYIDPDDQSVDEEYRGIGIRIEDDVLITATGHDVVTGAIPKEISQIER